MINRDGSFTVRRTGLGVRATVSLYHSLLTMSWPWFLVLVSTTYIATNTLFALAYLGTGPDAIAGPGELGFARAFFFSVQTLSGVGFGHLSPMTVAANLIVTAESLVGLLALALAAGLVFARFSRPTADIVFSRRAVVAPYRDRTGLMFRIANRRRNQIIELHADVYLSLTEQSNGRKSRSRSFRSAGRSCTPSTTPARSRV